MPDNTVPSATSVMIKPLGMTVNVTAMEVRADGVRVDWVSPESTPTEPVINTGVFRAEDIIITAYYG